LAEVHVPARVRGAFSLAAPSVPTTTVFSPCGRVFQSGLLRAILRRLGASGHALLAVASNRNLARMQLSFGAAWTAEWTFTVARSVVAFDQGGASAVGLITFLRLAPPAFLAPFSTTLADRYAANRCWSARVLSGPRRPALRPCSLLLMDFLPAVSGYSASVRGAQSLLDERLTTFTPDLT
jgi:hypothetical protein